MIIYKDTICTDKVCHIIKFKREFYYVQKCAMIKPYAFGGYIVGLETKSHIFESTVIGINGISCNSI